MKKKMLAIAAVGILTAASAFAQETDPFAAGETKILGMPAKVVAVVGGLITISAGLIIWNKIKKAANKSF